MDPASLWFGLPSVEEIALELFILIVLVVCFILGAFLMIKGKFFGLLLLVGTFLAAMIYYGVMG